MGLTVNEYSAAWHHDDDKSVVGQSLIQLIRMELDHHSVATHQLQERSNKNAYIHYSLFIHCVPSEFLGYPLLESGVDDKKKGKHVARTRRSLFEIGGVFRIPDYLSFSGPLLCAFFEL